MAAQLAAPVAALLAPYLEVVGALNERGRLKIYPGSPALARAWLRPQDRLIACEIEPQAAAALGTICAAISASRRLRSTAGPRWRPMCRRRSAAAWCWSIRRSSRTAISTACRTASPRRIANGPPAFMRSGIRSRTAANRTPWPNACAGWASAKILRAELTVAPLSDPTRLNGCGLILVNPPWTLESELSVLLPALAGILGRDGKGGFRLDWLAGEGGAGRPVTLWPLSTADPVGV